MKDSLVHQVWISLGSNLGNRKLQLARARNQVAGTCGKILRISGIYESSAWGFESEHLFFNQCLQLVTDLSPSLCMKELIKIELEMGRHRNGMGYTDRPIDLDILFYDALIIRTGELIIPHPRMAQRRFVLQPLQEIASDKKDPVTGLTVREMLAICEDPSRVTMVSS